MPRWRADLSQGALSEAAKGQSIDLLRPRISQQVSAAITLCKLAIYRYRPSEIYNLKHGCGYPPADSIQTLKEQKLFRNRGRRGGKKIQRPIPTITSERNRTKTKTITSERKETNTNLSRRRFLSEVPRVWYNLPSILLSNVTSLSNKMEEVTQAVRSTSCDVMAVTEA